MNYKYKIIKFLVYNVKEMNSTRNTDTHLYIITKEDDEVYSVGETKEKGLRNVAVEVTSVSEVHFVFTPSFNHKSLVSM